MDSTDRSTIYEDAFTYDQIYSPTAAGKDLEFDKNLAKGKKLLRLLAAVAV